MKRPLIAAVIAGATLGVACTAVLAAFTARGSGAPTIHATTMSTVTTAPTVSVSGRDVSVSWTQRVMANGTAVAGYTIARYPAAGGSAVTLGSACSGTVAALACTENSVAPGSWKYTVTPVQGNAWHGTESAQSSTATVASPSVSLSASVVAPSHSLTASIAGFDDGDAVTFHLGTASGTVIGTATASSAAGSKGTGSGTVTIPAGTSSGTYTVYAVGTDTATTSVVVDGTAPVVSATTVASNTTAPGYIAQGSSYFVYANASDSGGSNLASVSADVHNVTTGATSVTLVAGTYTVGATTYGFRSAALSANATLAAGSTAYSVTGTDGVGNTGSLTGSVTVDNTAPSIPATAIAPTSGGTAGTITAGSTYYVYANATDAASGVATVTANVANVTSGATAVALSSTGGPFTVNSTSYTYRSASQTADSGLSSGAKSYTVSATDNVGNASGATSGSVTVAAPPPVITAVAIAHTSNVTQQGALASGVAYYVYANVTDSGGPGVGTVTANVSSITSGKTAVALTAGTYSAFGNTYNYRFATSQTAGTLSGTLSYTVSASDTGSVAATPVNGSVTADNTAPTVSSISSSDNNGVVANGDTFVVVFNKQIDPATVDQTAGGATLTFSQSGNSHVLVAIPGLMAASDTGIAKATGQATPSWVTNGNIISYPGTLSISPNNKTVTFTVSGTCVTATCGNVSPGTAGQLQYVPDTSTASPFKLNDYAGNVPASTAVAYPTTGTIKVF